MGTRSRQLSICFKEESAGVMAAMEGIKKLKAEEGEEEEEEEDLVDPAMEIKERCGEDNCIGAKTLLDECNARVTGKTKTTETCFEEILDFYHCVDSCAAPKIFTQLK